MDGIFLLKLFDWLTGGSLLTVAAPILLFSWPLHRLADRVRPQTTERDHLPALLASAAIPAGAFLAACICLAIVVPLVHRPNELILEPVVAMWLVVLTVCGVTANLAVSCHRTWRWLQARRSFTVTRPPRR